MHVFTTRSCLPRPLGPTASLSGKMRYGPVFIAPLSIQIRRAGVQKKFGGRARESSLRQTEACRREKAGTVR